MYEQGSDELVQSADEKEHRHDKSRDFRTEQRPARQEEAGNDKQDGHEQVQKKPTPVSDHKCVDEFHDAGEQEHPSEENHRSYRGRKGPDYGGHAKYHQHDSKRHEPSPVMDHL